MNLQPFAQYWLTRRVAVIPVDWQTKRPALSSWNPYRDRLPSDDELRAWFRDDRFKAYGVVLGWRNLAVLDFDDMTAFRFWHEWARASELRAAHTYMVQSARGVHVYLAFQEMPAQGKFDGGDVKSRGGYVVGAGSLHPTGVRYNVFQDMRMVTVRRLADVLPGTMLSIPGAPAIPATPEILSNQPDNRSPLDCLDNPPAPVTCADVKAHVRAMDLLTTPIRPSGQGWALTTCPLHDDAHPSLAVNPRTGDVKCLAGCAAGRWLDAIGLYAALHHCPTQQALRDLAPYVQRG